MTPEQQRIAIAEACGWKPDDDGDGTGWKGSWIRRRLIGKKPTFRDGKVISYLIEQTVPDYLNDLNAMHEAEKETDMHYSQKWTTTLCEVMFESTSISVAGATKWDFALLCARSTAAQRAEAFLKTLNLWKP
jgi:hypothetical protein